MGPQTRGAISRQLNQLDRRPNNRLREPRAVRVPERNRRPFDPLLAAISGRGPADDSYWEQAGQ